MTLYGSTQIAFPTGHVLARVQLPDGDSYKTKVSWFAQHLKRPIAVAVGPDEALYLADFESGYVFQIQYGS